MGDLENIKTLLKLTRSVEGCDKASVQVDIKDRKGETALHKAALWGHRQVVARLLEAGADPKAKNARGQTPVDLAQGEEVKEVLRKAAEDRPAVAAALMEGLGIQDCTLG